MSNSNKKPEMSQIRQGVNAGLGYLTATNASAAAFLLSVGGLNAAFTPAALAGAALLYVTHVQEDDHKANGLKNYSIGYFVGAALSILAPPDFEANAQTLYNEEPKVLIVQAQSVSENNYPALETVAFD